MALTTKIFNGDTELTLAWNEDNSGNLEFKDAQNRDTLEFTNLRIKSQDFDWVRVVSYCMSINFGNESKEFLITAFNDNTDANMSWTCFFNCDEPDTVGIDFFGHCCPRNSLRGWQQ